MMTTTEFQMAMRQENEDADRALRMLAGVLVVLAALAVTTIGYVMLRLL